MAEILSVGRTQSATDMSINEDAFLLSAHLYPELLNGYEEKIIRETETWQIFGVAAGEGGPGKGDIVAREALRILQQIFDNTSKDDAAVFLPVFRSCFREGCRLLAFKRDRDSGSSCSLSA